MKYAPQVLKLCNCRVLFPYHGSKTFHAWSDDCICQLEQFLRVVEEKDERRWPILSIRSESILVLDSISWIHRRVVPRSKWRVVCLFHYKYRRAIWHSNGCCSSRKMNLISTTVCTVLGDHLIEDWSSVHVTVSCHGNTGLHLAPVLSQKWDSAHCGNTFSDNASSHVTVCAR